MYIHVLYMVWLVYREHCSLPLQTSESRCLCQMGRPLFQPDSPIPEGGGREVGKRDEKREEGREEFIAIYSTRIHMYMYYTMYVHLP